MTYAIRFTLISCIMISLAACETEMQQNRDSADQKEDTSQADAQEGLVENVLTKEEQDALSPEEVISMLKEGNERFMNNDLTARDHSEQVRKSTYAQYPKAIVLSCVDSRVPVEDIFDRGIGDMFVARVAGNFANEDILGSMEFACKVSGAKLILVLGHEHCGAVKAAIDDVELGNITNMLKNIQPAVEMVDYEGERTSKNQAFVHDVSVKNVKRTMQQIRERSPILKEMEENGEIEIVGAIYDMDEGSVDFDEVQQAELSAQE